MTTRPNILLLISDQQRGDCLGLEGHPVLQTPAMDFIGHSGARFRRAYSECPSCVPARRTIMTGQSPEAHGMVGMVTGVDWDPAHTLAGELGRVGYQTEMVGKLHLYPHRKRYGFDRIQLADSTRGPSNDYLDWLGGAVPIERWAMAHGVTPNGWIGRPSHLPETQTHSFWCVSEAIEFLTKRDPTVPFFLNVSFIDPHPPFSPPAFYFERYERQELPRPVIGDWAPRIEPRRGWDVELREDHYAFRVDHQSMHYCRAGYYGLINHVDNQISRLVQFMRDKKLFDDTFVLYVSDHGEMLGDHNMFAKIRPFEASARIPCLARAPRAWGLPTGVVSSRPVGLQDVMPTLLDVAGAPIPETVTGRSVLPLMRGEEKGWRETIHGEHSGTYHPSYAMHFLTDGHTKYAWYTQTGQELLFDLDADPNELRNLAVGDAAEGRLAPWRRRLVERLRDRPEGFVADGTLVAGRPHRELLAHAGRYVAAERY